MISEAASRPASPAYSSGSDLDSQDMATASEGETFDDEVQPRLRRSNSSSADSSSPSGSPALSFDSFAFFEASRDPAAMDDEERPDPLTPELAYSESRKELSSLSKTEYSSDSNDDEKSGDDPSAWTHVLSKSRRSIFVERLSLDRGTPNFIFCGIS
ncbi:hypothetical protein RQP46_001506 [Phenoliferia psychrophenolica]